MGLIASKLAIKLIHNTPPIDEMIGTKLTCHICIQDSSNHQKKCVYYF